MTVTSCVPFQIRRMDHIVLRIRDLKASLRFYLDALGCSMEKEQKQFGLYQVRAGDALIDLVPVDEPLGRSGGAAPGAEGRNVDHFAIQVTPFDEEAIRTHLAAHDIVVGEVGRRYGAEGYGPSIYVKDPDGNTVELKGPPDKS